MTIRSASARVLRQASARTIEIDTRLAPISPRPAIDATAPAAERLGVVEVIEWHRWDYSDTHEYPILEVVGLPLDAASADYLLTFGFTRFEERPNSFVAHRPATPQELP